MLCIIFAIKKRGEVKSASLKPIQLTITLLKPIHSNSLCYIQVDPLLRYISRDIPVKEHTKNVDGTMLLALSIGSDP